MARTSHVLPLAGCALLFIAGCTRSGAEEPLAAFSGGFDPTRYDAGVLPELAPDSLGRPLRFNVPPFYSESVAEGAARELERYLEEQLKIDVDVVTPRAYSYAELADALGRGEVDVAELSPYQFALVAQQGIAVEPLVASVAHGASSYGSYLVVKQGSHIARLADLKGKRVGMVDPMSTSGFLLPARHLREHGFDLDRDLTLTFLGSHPAAMQAVLDGEVDAAAVASDLLIGHAGLAGPLVVIAKAGRMPYDVIVARPGLDPAVVARVRAALLRLSIHDERGRAALRTFSACDGFMPVPPGHYDDIHALARKAAALAPAPPRKDLDEAPRGPQ
jgi:phosphonate transport system substrate-binding protein